MSEADDRASYRALFAVGEFRALFVAQVISVLGNVIAAVALAVLIYNRTHSPLLSALTFTLGFLPFLIGGTVLTGIVDRLPARRTMVTCDLVSAVVVALMVLHAPVAVLLMLIVVAGLVDPVFAGVRAAVLPELLGTGGQFVLGRAMFSMVWQGAQVIGYAAGGLLLAVAGARGALAIDAGSFLVSAVIVGLGTQRRAVTAATSGAVLREARATAKQLFGDREIRRLFFLRWLVPSCALAPEAIIAPYVRRLHAPTRDVGLLLTAIAAGMVVSSLAASRLLTPRQQYRTMMPLAFLSVAPLLALVAPLGVAASAGIFFVTGVGSSYSIGRDALFIAAVPESLRARALALDSSGLMVVQGIGFAIWGGIAEFAPLRTTIGIAGGLGVVIVTMLARRPPDDDHQAIA